MTEKLKENTSDLLPIRRVEAQIKNEIISSNDLVIVGETYLLNSTRVNFFISQS